MTIVTAKSLQTVPAVQWNALIGPADNPFLRHEFLAGLEMHGCVGARWGWHPQHLLAWDGERLLGAMPLYLKDNSYGELVFDWSWAEAYQRAGIDYYPKFVAAVPYSPVTGARVLLAPDAPPSLATELVQAALEQTRRSGASSLHVLFPNGEQTNLLQGCGLARRTGTQFHWSNRGYRDFDDFLQHLTAKRRNTIKRERRRVAEQGIEMEVLSGTGITDAHWQLFHGFYRGTFDRLGGYATLSEEFFRHLGQTMPESIVLVLARQGARYVAGAFSLRSGNVLYGRHWGSADEFHSLHFEACYYTGLDYCIRHGLARFEPGAQGEHKVGRGFEPVPTWSAHWLAHPAFFQAVTGYLAHEHQAMEDYRRELAQHLPYKT